METSDVDNRCVVVVVDAQVDALNERLAIVDQSVYFIRWTRECLIWTMEWKMEWTMEDDEWSGLRASK